MSWSSVTSELETVLSSYTRIPKNISADDPEVPSTLHTNAYSLFALSYDTIELTSLTEIGSYQCELKLIMRCPDVADYDSVIDTFESVKSSLSSQANFKGWESNITIEQRDLTHLVCTYKFYYGILTT